jgi:hypothetical protein
MEKDHGVTPNNNLKLIQETMNNLIVVSEYIDKRNGMKRLFDQNGREYEPLSGLNGLFDFLKPKDQGGSGFGNFLQKVGQTAVGIFKPKSDGTLERVDQRGVTTQYPQSPQPYIPMRPQSSGNFGLDSKTLMIGGAVLVGGLFYFLNKKK